MHVGISRVHWELFSAFLGGIMMHMGDITKCIWGFQFIGGYPLNALVIHHCTHDITLLHHDISPVTTINLKHLKTSEFFQMFIRRFQIQMSQ